MPIDHMMSSDGLCIIAAYINTNGANYKSYRGQDKPNIGCLHFSPQKYTFKQGIEYCDLVGGQLLTYDENVRTKLETWLCNKANEKSKYSI